MQKILSFGKSIREYRNQQQKPVFAQAKSYPPFFDRHLKNPYRRIKVFINDPNANIRVFYFQYLMLCYQIDNQNYQIYISKLKKFVLDPNFNFLFLQEDDESIFNDLQFKRFLLEFMDILDSGEFATTLEALNAYRIADVVLVYFFRSLTIYADLTTDFDSYIEKSRLFGFLLDNFNIDAQMFEEKCIKFVESEVFVYQQSPAEIYLVYKDIQSTLSDIQSDVQSEIRTEQREIERGQIEIEFLGEKKKMDRQESVHQNISMLENQQSQTQNVNTPNKKIEPNQKYHERNQQNLFYNNHFGKNYFDAHIRLEKSKDVRIEHQDSQIQSEEVSYRRSQIQLSPETKYNNNSIIKNDIPASISPITHHHEDTHSKQEENIKKIEPSRFDTVTTANTNYGDDFFDNFFSKKYQAAQTLGPEKNSSVQQLGRVDYNVNVNVGKASQTNQILKKTYSNPENFIQKQKQKQQQRQRQKERQRQIQRQSERQRQRQRYIQIQRAKSKHLQNLQKQRQSQYQKQRQRQKQKQRTRQRQRQRQRQIIQRQIQRQKQRQRQRQRQISRQKQRQKQRQRQRQRQISRQKQRQRQRQIQRQRQRQNQQKLKQLQKQREEQIKKKNEKIQQDYLINQYNFIKNRQQREVNTPRGNLQQRGYKVNKELGLRANNVQQADDILTKISQLTAKININITSNKQAEDFRLESSKRIQEFPERTPYTNKHQQKNFNHYYDVSIIPSTNNTRRTLNQDNYKNVNTQAISDYGLNQNQPSSSKFSMSRITIQKDVPTNSAISHNEEPNNKVQRFDYNFGLQDAKYLNLNIEINTKSQAHSIGAQIKKAQMNGYGSSPSLNLSRDLRQQSFGIKDKFRQIIKSKLSVSKQFTDSLILRKMGEPYNSNIKRIKARSRQFRQSIINSIK